MARALLPAWLLVLWVGHGFSRAETRTNLDGFSRCGNLVQMP